ncbi:hypothetical protein OSCT_1700 [Oscillochloris trichoides DG-6]|uniref:HTH cro/C1-type domain-containing protein n=1 Tax=Oscillochloris trichoides DG-6 TaxID=765420 RepID=E1IEE9_9CHLR|nr:hypothetical protein [Oscillochloris trichoides]EFO80475.1 hypothetical protein OSCT_1700 [Oscillochloris trichoides DG-6]
MITPTIITRSLEDYRAEQLMNVREFANYLGINEATYRRLLTDPQKVQAPLRRRVRDTLKVSPYLVKELYPYPSAHLQAQNVAGYNRAQQEGWIEVDDDLEPTGRIFDHTGNER